MNFENFTTHYHEKVVSKHRLRTKKITLKTLNKLLYQLQLDDYYCFFDDEKQSITLGLGSLYDNQPIFDHTSFEVRQFNRTKLMADLPQQISMIPFDIARNTILRKTVKQPILTITPEIVIEYKIDSGKVNAYGFIQHQGNQVTEYEHLLKLESQLNSYCEVDSILEKEYPLLTFAFEKEPKIYQKQFEQAKEAIRNGDVFQLVLSNTLSAKGNCDLVKLFEHLLTENASPYLLLFQCKGESYLSATPEILVKKENNKLLTVPIAGTCPRKYDGNDLNRELALLSDPKERAEHLMLVDLGRNDIGRVSLPGSVHVTSYAAIKKLSKVMHIASTVEGTQLENTAYLDPLLATMPAGTVTGAPKKMAMTLIDTLENSERKHYAGTFLIEDSIGNYTSLITIRTLHQSTDQVSIRVGSGIVADSSLKGESDELIFKALGLISALEATHTGGVKYDFSHR